MIRIFRARDFGFKGYDRCRKIIGYLEKPSARPAEYREKSFVDLLVENEKAAYSLQQIRLDQKAGILYPADFAVNYGSTSVDCRPLVRGFVPDAEAVKSTLYEVMPVKRELHKIPDPAHNLFHESMKIPDRNSFYFDGTLEDVIEAFKQRGFHILEFLPRFDSPANSENFRRYFREQGFENLPSELLTCQPTDPNRD